ncbi:MAG: hypothetical protein H0W84_09675 [Bacteroidetes bacterium]|nr:hypothetical protein [Bacteroidota bacterium]
MKSKENKKNPPGSGEDLPGYPSYPDSEDIYKTDKEIPEIDPDDPTHKKSPNPAPDDPKEKDFNQVKTGDDLDVPGSELDDDQENIGEEDEENNYYSLGGDDHEDS